MKEKTKELNLEVRLRRLVLLTVKKKEGQTGLTIAKGIWNSFEEIKKRHKKFCNFYRCVNWHLKKLYKNNYIYFRIETEEEKKTSAAKKFWYMK